MALKVGDVAPDFELPAVEGDQRLNIKLSDFRGKKNVVVSFHPLNWTPTCSEQLPAFDSDREKFAALNAQLLDISIDSVYSHMAWQKHAIGAIHFPMCSDIYPHAKVTQAFGIMREGPPLPGSANGQHSSWTRTAKLRLPRYIRWTRSRTMRNYWRR